MSTEIRKVRIFEKFDNPGCSCSTSTGRKLLSHEKKNIYEKFITFSQWDKQEVLGKVHICLVKFQVQAYNDYVPSVRILISISHRAYAYCG